MDSRLICTCGLSESEMTGRLFACSISAMYTHTGLPPKLSDNWRALINYMHAYMYTYIYIYTYRVTPNALGHECPHKLHTFLQMCTNILYLLSDIKMVVRLICHWKLLLWNSSIRMAASAAAESQHNNYSKNMNYGKKSTTEHQPKN